MGFRDPTIKDGSQEGEGRRRRFYGWYGVEPGKEAKNQNWNLGEGDYHHNQIGVGRRDRKQEKHGQRQAELIMCKTLQNYVSYICLVHAMIRSCPPAKR